MNRRSLGSTGLEVSEIAFGGVEIGIPYGIGVRTEADMLSENEAIRLIHESIDSGINFYDTARMYGNSEAIMGRAFAGIRNQIVIATKCRHFRDHTGRLPPSAEIRGFVRRSLEESLNALQTDFVDLYMLHQSDLEILSHHEIQNVFSDLKKEGRVRAIGASTYSVAETSEAIKSGLWDLVQIPFNLMDQSHEGLFKSAVESGVAITVRSVLMKGLLASGNIELHPALHAVQQHIENYRDLLNESITDLVSLALKFALSYKEVASVLLGIDKSEYLHKALAIADGRYLNSTQMEQVKSRAYPDPEFLNLQHWQKAGWLP